MHLGYYYVTQRYDDFATVAGWNDVSYRRIWDESDAKDEFKSVWLRNRDKTYRLIKCFDSDSETRHIKEIIQVIQAKNP